MGEIVKLRFRRTVAVLCLLTSKAIKKIREIKGKLYYIFDSLMGLLEIEWVEKVIEPIKKKKTIASLVFFSPLHDDQVLRIQVSISFSVSANTKVGDPMPPARICLVSSSTDVCFM